MTISSPSAHVEGLLHAVEDELVAPARAVAGRCPSRRRVEVERGDVAGLVRQQRHLRRVRGELVTWPTRPCVVHDRRRAGCPSSVPAAITTWRLEVARRGAMITLAPTGLKSSGKRAESLVVRAAPAAARSPGRQRGLRSVARGRLASSALQLLVLGLRVDEAAEVAVGVLERLRDALGGDLERPQDGRAGALDAVQRAAARLAEVDRDQHERDDDEHADDDAAPDQGRRAGGVRGRCERCDVPTQDRQPAVRLRARERLV